MEIRKNDIITLKIEDWSSEGMGIAKKDGLVIFVKGAARGDVLRALILKTAKNAAWAKATEIIEPSIYRIENDCPYFPLCGGCDFRHISYDEELSLKAKRVENAFMKIGGIKLAPENIYPSPEINNYRNKAVFPVGRQEGRPVFGVYRQRSHDIVKIDGCKLQKAAGNICAAAVLRYMSRYNIEPYDEKTGRGIIRQIYTRVNKKGEVLCTIVSARRDLPHTFDLIQELRASYSDAAGIFLNYHPDKTNNVLGKSFELLWGRDFIEDTLSGFNISLSPGSFYQINTAQAERLYEKALFYAGEINVALDLYCGIGAFTMYLASRAKEAYGIEIIESAVEDARHNAERNGLSNTHFILGDALNGAKELYSRKIKPSVITVDPPRKGLTPAVIGLIADMAPENVIYISCDPATLARDTAIFKNHGYIPERYSLFDMFPRTANAECAAKLTRCRTHNQYPV